MPTASTSVRELVLRSLALIIAVGLGACTGKNADHCNFRGGDSFCGTSQETRPYCSVCEASFDGCVAEAPSSECLPEGSSSAATVVSDTASSTSTSTSTSSTGESTSTSSTTDGTTTSSTSSTSTSDGTTTSTSTSDDSSSSTTEAPPECGNGELDENEVCDGDLFGGKTCLDFNWTGGKLQCSRDCNAIDQSMCCQGAGSECAGNKPCCEPLACQFEGLSLKCK